MYNNFQSKHTGNDFHTRVKICSDCNTDKCSTHKLLDKMAETMNIFSLMTSSHINIDKCQNLGHCRSK